VRALSYRRVHVIDAIYGATIKLAVILLASKSHGTVWIKDVLEWLHSWIEGSTQLAMDGFSYAQNENVFLYLKGKRKRKGLMNEFRKNYAIKYACFVTTRSVASCSEPEPFSISLSSSLMLSSSMPSNRIV